jgi:DNA (cytosine-5)-methyltransferase 1
MSAIRIGSLCSGYEGIGMGLAAALGIDLGLSLAWHAEYEAAPSAVLAHHWPHVPNLHDIKLIDWAYVLNAHAEDPDYQVPVYVISPPGGAV